MKKIFFTLLLVILAAYAGYLTYSVGKKYDTKNNSSLKENVINQVATFKTGSIVGVGSSKVIGNYLTDSKGMTLYVSNKDTNLESKCDSVCTQRWPIFEYDNQDLEKSSDPYAKKLNIIKANNKKYLQYAYGAKPLYRFSGDTKPGDLNGIGANSGEWSIVKIVDIKN